MSRNFLNIIFGLALLGIIFFQSRLFGSEGKKPDPPPPQNSSERNLSAVLPLAAKLPEFASPSALTVENNPQFYPIRDWNVPAIELRAKAAAAADLSSERLFYQKNINESLPIASISKLMTALVVLENYDLDGLIKISKTAVDAEGDRGGLFLDEVLTVKSLLKIMLIESSNDAAVALAEKNGELSVPKFVELMNQRALDLDMRRTNFKDPAGLNGGNVSSVSDLLKLARHLFAVWPGVGEITAMVNVTVFSADGSIPHNLKNTNRLLEGESIEIIGGKTGYLDEAGGCLLVLARAGEKNKIVTVALGSSDRFGETEQLINWLKEAYIWK